MRVRHLAHLSGRTTALIAVAAFAVGAVGANVIAQHSDEDIGEEAPPGVPYREAEPTDANDRVITTGGSNYDASILTKFIPGTGFVATQGDGDLADLIRVGDHDSTCVFADNNSGGTAAQLRAPVELPDGSRIRQIVLYGVDNVGTNILVRLTKTTVAVPTSISASPTRIDTEVTEFGTAGESGVVVVASDAPLNEVVGSKPGTGIVAGIDHQFHQVFVQLDNGAGNGHRLCGVEVLYQVPVASAAGTMFNPVAPYRAYDSRKEMEPVADGPLGAGPARLIPVGHGRDVGTGVIDQLNAIPAHATAVAYTVTADGSTGSGFLFVGPGDATSIDASSLNWDENTIGAIANSGIVPLSGDRQVAVFAGGSTGAMTDFIIDITGYYAAAVYPNMGN